MVFQPSKNVKPFIRLQPLWKHGRRDLTHDPQFTEHWHKPCMFFLSLGPHFLPQIHLLASLHLSFTLTSILSIPFPSAFFNLPFCPKALKDPAWYLAFCSPDDLCSSWCLAGSVICLFSILCLPSRLYISGGRAELTFYVSMCLIESCPTPTWCSINIQEQNGTF